MFKFLTKEYLFLFLTKHNDIKTSSEQIKEIHQKLNKEKIDNNPEEFFEKKVVLKPENSIIKENNFNYEQILNDATKEHKASYSNTLTNFLSTNTEGILFSLLGNNYELKAGSKNGIIIGVENQTIKNRMLELDLSRTIKEELEQIFKQDINYYPVYEEE